MTLEETTARHLGYVGLSMQEPGSQATIRNSALVAHDGAGAHYAGGMSAIQGSKLEVEGSAVVNARGFGIAGHDEGTTLSLARSLVTGTMATPALDQERAAGWGVVVAKNAVGNLFEVALVDNEQTALYVSYEAKVTGRAVVIDGTKSSADGALGVAAYVMEDARLVLQNSAIRRSSWLGLVVMRASGAVESSSFEDNARGAVNVWETNVSRPRAVVEPSFRELVLTNNTFRTSAPEIQEGLIEVRLPSSTAPSF